jgi:hypothetical protein
MELGKTEKTWAISTEKSAPMAIDAYLTFPSHPSAQHEAESHRDDQVSYVISSKRAPRSTSNLRRIPISVDQSQLPAQLHKSRLKILLLAELAVFFQPITNPI